MITKLFLRIIQNVCYHYLGQTGKLNAFGKVSVSIMFLSIFCINILHIKNKHPIIRSTEDINTSIPI